MRVESKLDLDGLEAELVDAVIQDLPSVNAQLAALKIAEVQLLSMVVGISDRVLDIGECSRGLAFLRHWGDVERMEHPLLAYNMVKALWGVGELAEAREVLGRAVASFPGADYLHQLQELVHLDGVDAEVLRC